VAARGRPEASERRRERPVFSPIVFPIARIRPMSQHALYYRHDSESDDDRDLDADPSRPGATRSPFRSGEAGMVWLTEEGYFETDTRIAFGPNTYHSLVVHGVVAALAALPLEMGPLEVGSEAVLAPASLPAALRLFYEADRETYGVKHDLLVARAWGSPPADYRIEIDNREYQRTLSKLQFVASEASRMGHGLRLKL